MLFPAYISSHIPCNPPPPPNISSNSANAAQLRWSAKNRCFQLDKALRYKQKGREFETRWGEWFLLIYLNLPAELGPEISSVPNRNEYRGQK
jgi:hypothetical protein